MIWGADGRGQPFQSSLCQSRDHWVCSFLVLNAPPRGIYTPKMVFNTVEFNTVEFNTMVFNTVEFNTVVFNTVEFNTVV